jgi:hypothetical protein
MVPIYSLCNFMQFGDILTQKAPSRDVTAVVHEERLSLLKS